MKFSVLSSGSKANCTYIDAASTKVLIDCGLSVRQVEKRLHACGVNAEELSAILVTHEHRDHIYGVEALSRKYHLPVYANSATARFLSEPYGCEFFTSDTDFSVGRLQIKPTKLLHDAAEPVGFSISAEGLKFTQVTDLGEVTPQVREALSGSHAVVLESNHDPLMLQECYYPQMLKERIASSHGHLSNDSAGELLAQTLHPELFHLVLGHISQNSNTPEIALSTVKKHIASHKNVIKSITCASVARATPLFEVGEARVVQLLAIGNI